MARSCEKCGAAMTDAATFCTVCGAEAPVLAQVDRTEPAMSTGGAKFCVSCGSSIAPDAKFCANCGTPVGQAPAGQAAAPVIPPQRVPEPGQPDADVQSGTRNRTLIIGAMAAGVLFVAILFWINRYNWLGLEPPVENAAAASDIETTMYTIASANLRDRATSQGSSIVGKLPRGSKVSGVLELGEDGISNWFQIAESGHFVSAVNLSEVAPPSLARSLNKAWYAGADMPILSRPQPGAAVLMTAAPGTKLQLVGLTAGGFAEVLLEKGGVGYFDASGIDIEAGSAQPIDVAFVPAGCGFGREVQMLFRKLGQDSQARFEKAEGASYPDEDTRAQALDEFPGKSDYLPLTRSWMGLRVGGIGTHAESVSIYFKEPMSRVIEVLGKPYQIDSTGQFTTEGDAPTSAGIAPTDDEERKYGMTELSCGV